MARAPYMNLRVLLMSQYFEFIWAYFFSCVKQINQPVIFFLNRPQKIDLSQNKCDTYGGRAKCLHDLMTRGKGIQKSRKHAYVIHGCILKEEGFTSIMVKIVRWASLALSKFHQFCGGAMLPTIR